MKKVRIHFGTETQVRLIQNLTAESIVWNSLVYAADRSRKTVSRMISNMADRCNGGSFKNTSLNALMIDHKRKVRRQSQVFHAFYFISLVVRIGYSS